MNIIICIKIYLLLTEHKAHFKFPTVGVVANRNGTLWAVSPPPTRNAMMQQFEMRQAYQYGFW
jgi:hypothetical protein